MMKLTCVAVAAICLIVASARSVEDDRKLFQDFVATYNRQYTAGEKVHKFECFRTNLKLIDERNAKGAEQHGVNQFADVCPEEFARAFLGMKSNRTTAVAHPTFVTKPTASQQIDWRTKGAVTPIKNQGNCGSCWSFSATGNMEGQWFLAGNTLVGLSEEELVQCSSSTGNEGCNGGLMDWAFEWVTSNGGIDSESDYPYTSGGGTTGTCVNSKLGNKVAKFSGHTDMPKSESSMATWVFSNGPLAIGVDAITWSSYTGGIMKNCNGKQLDHGVLIVGFNQANSPPYWIVKNSWGTSWGENGYLRLEYGTDQCGITQAASSAIAQKS